MVDTGAEVCAAGEALLDFIRFPRKKLLPPDDNRLMAYCGNPVDCVGILPIKVKNQFKEVETKVHIVKKSSGTLLLSLKDSMMLQFLPQEFPEALSSERWQKPATLLSIGQESKPAQGAEAPVQKYTVKKLAVYGRSMQSKVPVAEVQLNQAPKSILSRRQMQKDRDQIRYDATAKSLPKLKRGMRVRVQNWQTKRWDKEGTLLRVTNRNCLIKLGAHWNVWLNRRFVRAVPGEAEELPSSLPPMASTRGRRKMTGGDSGEKRVRFNLPSNADATPPLRRSARARRPPDRLGVQPRRG